MGKPAAHATDITAHPGTLVPSGPMTVLIDGKPAVNVGYTHVCSKVEAGPVPHVGGPANPGTASQTVKIMGLPAVRVGDQFLCTGAGGAPAAVQAAGPPSQVLIGD